MARKELNVINFNAYNQAIYPFDYYEVCLSTDTGAILVVESSASTGQINYNDETLIGKDGLALFATAPTTTYVRFVEGFFKAVDSETLEGEFLMGRRDEQYLLIATNTTQVSTYYVECLQTDDNAIKVVASGTSTGEIAYNNAALVGPDGTALYGSSPTGKYVKAVSGTKTLTVLKGNHIQAIADFTVTLKHKGTYYIRIESGRYKNVYGDDKGKVVIRATDTLVKAAVLRFE